jgi:hypothetical protein
MGLRSLWWVWVLLRSRDRKGAERGPPFTLLKPRFVRGFLFGGQFRQRQSLRDSGIARIRTKNSYVAEPHLAWRFFPPRKSFYDRSTATLHLLTRANGLGLVD